MGNRATRRLANQLLKENGIFCKFAKLKRGRHVNKTFINSHAKMVVRNLTYGKKGLVISECNGLNYVSCGFFRWNVTHYEPIELTKENTWGVMFGKWLCKIPNPMLCNNGTDPLDNRLIGCRFLCFKCFDHFVSEQHKPFTKEKIKKNVLRLLKPFVCEDATRPYTVASEPVVDELKVNLFKFLLSSKDNHCCDEQGKIYDEWLEAVFY